MESDYLKLSEQYASFLVAVGGVSITVLALVLSFGPTSVRPDPESESESAELDLRAFLVAALVVATVSCFIGAQMMAETAAFINYSKGTSLGERLFLLASANIFIAISLVLFSLMLLLTISGRVDATIIKPLAVWVFRLVLVGAVGWVILAAKYRMPAPSGWLASVPPALISVVWGIIIYRSKNMSRKRLLSLSFIPIVSFTVLLLLYFAWTFADGGKVHDRDIFLFSFAITFSYTSLIVAGTKAISLAKLLTDSAKKI